ncbi:hypothetical protein Q4E93_19280 [Flavitalea sp. BT771]|uniref:hypothetical protein n=1 Tax=Flavitalea sp. BT771 TaxID=3063329 RepID=UPI0026E45D1F|nr:hypothetical protein [Flavitalea sp. BT771]MDO6432758.1 hypothetical protein [Flavitalea sp. BT771]MDV6221966.1 hypothetical protein [Flavitalea sp. BT771]
MRHLTILLFFPLLSFFARAQKSGDREGVYAGLSLGYFHYQTYWYYHSSASPHDHNPVHSINRAIVSISLEKKGAWQVSAFQFDLGGELLLGPTGKAKGAWLPGDDVISSGGWSAGLNAYGRAVYMPPSQTGAVRFYPFVSLGPQYMFLHNNGKGTGPYASESGYNYTDGWNEGVILFTSSIGVDLSFDKWDKWVLMPELRFGLFGWNSSSWEPRGSDVSMNGGPGFLAFSVRVSRRL